MQRPPPTRSPQHGGHYWAQEGSRPPPPRAGYVQLPTWRPPRRTARAARSRPGGRGGGGRKQPMGGLSAEAHTNPRAAGDGRAEGGRERLERTANGRAGRGRFVRPLLRRRGGGKAPAQSVRPLVPPLPLGSRHDTLPPLPGPEGHGCPLPPSALRGGLHQRHPHCLGAHGALLCVTHVTQRTGESRHQRRLAAHVQSRYHASHQSHDNV